MKKLFPLMLIALIAGEVLQAVQGFVHAQINSTQGFMLAASALFHIIAFYCGWLIFGEMTAGMSEQEPHETSGD